MANIFFEIGSIMIIATVLAYFAKFLKQPLIPAYIFTGILLGPLLGIITNAEIINNFSEIGIAFLLFIVGLEIDVRKLKYVGLVASLGGVIQIALTSAIAFAASLALGFFAIESAYIALIIAFSSTMVVVKLLSDRKEVDTLHGKIIIGILLLQDIVAIIALSVLASLDKFSVGAILYSFFQGIIILILSFLASKHVIPFIFSFAAKSRELLFISAVSLSFFYSILFSRLGFSIAIGAFVAGISLANLPYNIEIIGRIKPLRDFFSVMFFVSLGMQLMPGTFGPILKPLLAFILLTVAAKTIITMLTASFFGYKKRTSFLTAISLAQISEFSLILAALGLSLGHLSQEIFSMTILLAIATIILTTYFIKYEDELYRALSGALSFLDKLSRKNMENAGIPAAKNYEAILCGYNRIGFSILKTLKKMRKGILVVDFNPEVARHLSAQGIPSIYGDVGDIEVLERLNFRKAKIVISTVPAKSDNLLLIDFAKKQNNKITIFATASQIQEALELYDAGADYVVMPHFLGGNYVSVLIEKFDDGMNKILQHKLQHIKELKERHALGHEHPGNER